jgi:hypothetical protein
MARRVEQRKREGRGVSEREEEREWCCSNRDVDRAGSSESCVSVLARARASESVRKSKVDDVDSRRRGRLQQQTHGCCGEAKHG